MPRPNPFEKRYDERSYQRRSAWPAILLASPFGLLVALIVLAEIRSSAPTVLDAGAAPLAVPSTARPESIAVPAAIGGPALGTARPTPEATHNVRTVPAAKLREILADPAVREFKGLSENAWDFTRPAGVPGFAQEPNEPARGPFKLTSDE